MESEEARSEAMPRARHPRKKVWLTVTSIVVALIVFGCWCWYDMNVTPVVTIPPAPPLPKENAVAAFTQAAGAIVYEKQPGEGLSAIDGADAFNRMSQSNREALLQRNAAVLSRLEHALALPYVEPGLREANPKQPHLTNIRKLARFCDFAAKTRAAAGDWAGSLDVALQGIAMSSRLTHDTTLLPCFVGIFSNAMDRKPAWATVAHLDAAIARPRAQRLETLLSLHPADTASVLREQKYADEVRLLALFRMPRKKLADTFEEADSLISIFGRAKSAWEQKKRYFALLTYHKRHTMNAVIRYDEAYITRASQPYAARSASSPRPDALMPACILPDLEVFLGKMDGTTCLNHLLLLSLALRAYQSEHGKAPASLSALVPDYLSAVPGDPFDKAGSFHYRTTATVYVLYSVGPDGVDDGGRASSDATFTTQTTGDIVAGVNRW